MSGFKDQDVPTTLRQYGRNQAASGACADDDDLNGLFDLRHPIPPAAKCAAYTVCSAC